MAKGMIVDSPGYPRALRPRPGRHVRLVADLGLALLVTLALETLTGLVLFLFAHGLTPRGSAWAAAAFSFLARNNLLMLQDISFQTDVHVWIGYVTTAVIAVKGVAAWPALTGWRPRRFSAARLVIEKGVAWAVIVLAPASYLTGIALALHWLPFENRAVLDLHLWVSAALVLLLGWHVWRFFPEGIRVMTVQIRRGIRGMA